MRHATPSRLVVAAVLALASPAAAQNYGPQPGFQPGPYQPAPYQQPNPYAQPGPYQQPGPFQPNPYQPGTAPPAGQVSGGPSLVGTWSGQSNGPNGMVQQSDAFSADGRFVSVARLPNGFLARVWGTYRSAQVSPNQLRLQTQLEGWLPREVCQQQAGGQPQCQPFQIPTSDTSLVTFSSPSQFQSMSEANAGGMVNEMRDNQPALLQAQAPQRWLTVLQPSANPGPAPVIAPYVNPSSRGPATNIPGLGGNCDDLQQRRICGINDGQLIRGRDGCLRCSR